MDPMGEFRLHLPRSRYVVPEILRGISAIFWALPIALVASIQVTLDDYAPTMRFLFPVAAFGLQAYGAHQLRWLDVVGAPNWRRRVDTMRVMALAQLLLSPFLLFFARGSDYGFFTFSIFILGWSWCGFIYSFCSFLGPLTASLPEKSLVDDYLWIKGFISGALFLICLSWSLLFLRQFIFDARQMPFWLYLAAPQWLGTFLIISAIFPVTVLMNLTWKVKEYLFYYALDQDYGPSDAVENSMTPPSQQD
jgi:hypothetical protein